MNYAGAQTGSLANKRHCSQHIAGEQAAEKSCGAGVEKRRFWLPMTLVVVVGTVGTEALGIARTP
jgi:hypothetical protein